MFITFKTKLSDNILVIFICLKLHVSVWSAMWYMVVLLVANAAAHPESARHFSGQEIHQLPELYQLDDYDRCLSRPGALYCVGTFHLTPAQQPPSHQYQLIQEYSSDTLHFNRTFLHRGYCVSSRCSSEESNSTDRFLSCVRDNEKHLGMQLSLVTHQCDVNSKHLDTKEGYDDILLWVVGVLLLLNVIGTAYDTFGRSQKKNEILVAWSVPFNWYRLTQTQGEKDDSPSPLSVIHGTRIILMVTFVSFHVFTISHQLFLNNPDALEKIYTIPVMMLARNGSTFVQLFVLISSFLFTFSFIQISKVKKIGYRHFPIFLVHRIIRLAPVHMLVVGFAATWWRYTGDGPLWPDMVVAESDVCRRKFFLHAFFLHNLIDNDAQCLVQSWFLAVDVQLFILTSLVLITLKKIRRKPIPILIGLSVCSVALNGSFAYFNGWKPLVHILNPESFRTFFRDTTSSFRNYVSPWASVPACFIGMLTAYTYEEIQEKRLNFNSKMFKLVSVMSLPLLLSLVLAGTSWVYEQQGPLFSSLYIALERPVLCIFMSTLFIGMVKKHNHFLRRVLSWRGWHAPGRLSLSVLMVHWCVIKIFLASRRTLTDFTLLNMTIETCASCFFSFCLALPLTLLVEMPLLKSFTSALVD